MYLHKLDESSCMRACKKFAKDDMGMRDCWMGHLKRQSEEKSWNEYFHLIETTNDVAISSDVVRVEQSG